MSFFLILLFLFSSSSVFSKDVRRENSGFFRVGEKLVYRLDGIIEEWRLKGNLGSLEIEILEITNIGNRSYYHGRAVARSSLLLRSRYPLNDVYESWFDTQTFKSILIQKRLREGKFRDKVVMKIDPNRFTSIYWNKKYPQGKKGRVSRDGYDILGFFYYLRAHRKQQNFGFTIYDSEFERRFYLKVKDGGMARVKPLFKLKKRNKKFHLLTFCEQMFYGLSINIAVDGDFIPVSVNTFSLASGGVHLSGRIRLVRYK